MNNWRYNLRYIFTFIAQCNFPATSFVCHCIPLLPNVVVLKIFRFSRCLYAYRNDYITTECNLSFIALKKKNHNWKFRNSLISKYADKFAVSHTIIKLVNGWGNAIDEYLFKYSSYKDNSEEIYFYITKIIHAEIINIICR